MEIRAEVRAEVRVEVLARITEELEVRGPTSLGERVVVQAGCIVRTFAVQIPPAPATLAVATIDGLEGYVILTGENCEAIESEAVGEANGF